MAKVSDRTKSLKKKKAVFGWLTYAVWLATAAFFIVYAFISLGQGHSGMKIFSDDVNAWLIGVGTTTAIALLGTIIIKDKMMSLVWMLTLILSVILFDKTGMIIVLGIWAVDEYIFKNLFTHYCHLVQINKEIDKR